MRKSFAYVLLSMMLTLSTTVFCQLTIPREPSPAAMVAQTIGISTVTVKYSRPSVKGREVWGALVPYGWNVQAFGTGNSAPWRAGANENTVLELSDDAKIEGHAVPAGAYGLSFVINKDNTGEVILSKDNKSWGSFFYDPKQDELRAPINLRDIAQTEMLTYEFINSKKNSSELVLNWEKKQFPVKIEFDVDKIFMDNADKELKGAVGFNPNSFTAAANYSLQNKTDLDKGLSWIDKAIAGQKNFTNFAIKSNILKAMGKNEEADKIMNDALAANPSENELNAYGYQLMADGKTDKAIDVFVLATKKYSNSANTWDSLGEAYATKGDKKNAIINFKKALSMNPPANVKANSEKFLHQLGAM